MSRRFLEREIDRDWENPIYYSVKGKCRQSNPSESLRWKIHNTLLLVYVAKSFGFGFGVNSTGAPELMHATHLTPLSTKIGIGEKSNEGLGVG